MSSKNMKIQIMLGIEIVPFLAIRQHHETKNSKYTVLYMCNQKEMSMKLSNAKLFCEFREHACRVLSRDVFSQEVILLEAARCLI